MWSVFGIDKSSQKMFTFWSIFVDICNTSPLISLCEQYLTMETSEIRLNHYKSSLAALSTEKNPQLLNQM